METCLFSLTYLFNYYLYEYTLMYFYFILKVKIQHRIYFVAQMAPVLATGIFFPAWLLCCVGMIHFFFFLNTSLLSGIMKYSRFILCISCPKPTLSMLLKRLAWILLLGIVSETNIWVVGDTTGF